MQNVMRICIRIQYSKQYLLTSVIPAGHDQCGPSSNAKYDENDRAADVLEVQGTERTTGWLMMMLWIIEQHIFTMLGSKGEGVMKK